MDRAPEERLARVGALFSGVAAAGATVLALGAGPAATLAGGAAAAGAALAFQRAIGSPRLVAAKPSPSGTADFTGDSPLAITRPDGTFVRGNAAYGALVRRAGRPASTSPVALLTQTEARRAVFVHLARLARGESDAVPLMVALEAAPGCGVRRELGLAITSWSSGEGADAGGPLLLWRFCRLDRADGTREVTGSTAADGGWESFALEIVAIVPVAAAVVDRTGAIAAANELFRQALGLPEDPRSGSAQSPRLDAFVAPDGDTSLTTLFAGDPPAGRIAAAIVRPHAAPSRRLRLSARSIAGTATGLTLLTLSDITEQSALEAQLTQNQKLQAVGQLAGGVAHDFNNVLTAVVGFSDLLLQRHRPGDPSFRDIMNIKQSANRAAGLVKQLLAFSRRQTLRPTRLQLNDVIADLALMLDRLRGADVRLEIEYGRDLWPVLADVGQLEQVVTNLVVNARDAMKGRGRLTIRTRNVPGTEVAALDIDDIDGDAVMIEIADTGGGIAPDVLDKIFEPFFTTKPPGEGTGLGLSTVYGIVKQTGGALKVQSTIGQGTTFLVLLPRARHDSAVATETSEDHGWDRARPPRLASRPGIAMNGNRPEEAAAEPTASAAASDLTGDATILLVEDEEAIRVFAARALTTRGYRVLTAASGAEALALMRERSAEVALLVSDVMMPEMSGPALLREVRTLRPDLSAIFISGYADRSVDAELDGLADCRFLPKPFSLKTLAETVKAMLAEERNEGAP